MKNEEDDKKFLEKISGDKNYKIDYYKKNFNINAENVEEF
jgi:hypothetical protein